MPLQPNEGFSGGCQLGGRQSLSQAPVKIASTRDRFVQLVGQDDAAWRFRRRNAAQSELAAGWTRLQPSRLKSGGSGCNRAPTCGPTNRQPSWDQYAVGHKTFLPRHAHKERAGSAYAVRKIMSSGCAAKHPTRYHACTCVCASVRMRVTTHRHVGSCHGPCPCVSTARDGVWNLAESANKLRGARSRRLRLNRCVGLADDRSQEAPTSITMERDGA